MTFSIWFVLAAIALFCAGYTVGHAAGQSVAQSLRESIAREIARTVIEIDEKERKEAEKRNKSAGNAII